MNRLSLLISLMILTLIVVCLPLQTKAYHLPTHFGFVIPRIPFDHPPNPTQDIEWSAGYSGIADIQSAFNHARSVESAQLGVSLPSLTIPYVDSSWNAQSNSDKAIYLINQERLARGVQPLYGVESNVTIVAQSYAQYLLDNDWFDHYDKDGKSPWDRLNANPTIGSCHDFLPYAENLAVFVTTGTNIPLPVERAVYNWMYNDSASSWGHRIAILYYPYDDNSGVAGEEGFVGIGLSNGGPYQGPFDSPWPYASLVVMNIFDPCSSWVYAANNQQGIYLPLVIKDTLPPFADLLQNED